MFKHRKVFVLCILVMTLILSVGAIWAADDDITSDTDSINIHTSDENIAYDTVTGTQDNNKNLKNDWSNTTVMQNTTVNPTNTVTINKDNYEDNGWVKEEDDYDKFAIFYDGSGDVTFIFEDTIDDNLNAIAIESGNNITIKANPDVEFKNVAFSINAADNVTLKDLKINIDDTYVATEIFNSNIIYVSPESSGAIIDNVSVNYYLPESISVPSYPACVVDIQSDADVINSEFIITTYTSTVDWDTMSPAYGTNKVMPIRSWDTTNSHDVKFINNTIFINATVESGGYPTLYALTFGTPNTLVSNNNIEIHGTGWLYAVNAKADYCDIKNNNITVHGTNYTGGIFIEDYSHTTIDNNTITLYSLMSREGTMNEPCTYGVVITNYAYKGGTYREGTGHVANNTVSNNRIICTANNMYGIEQFGGDNTTIVNNTMSVNGETAMGIGIIGANTVIANNDLTVNGSVETAGTVDYLNAITTGVYLARGFNNQLVNNSINSTIGGVISDGEHDDVIESNTILTESDYAIKLRSTNNTIVTDNYLVSSKFTADQSVNSTTTTNVIENNLPEAEPIDSQIIITTNITNVEYNDLVDFEGYFSVNGEKSYFDNIKVYDNDELVEIIESFDNEGTIFYTYDANTIGNHEIKFVFEGNDTHNPSETTLNIYVGEVIEAQATIIDFDLDDSYISGEDLTVDAVIHTEDETPVAGAVVQITLKANNQTVMTNTATSDEDGSISSVINTSDMSGNIVIKILFNGNDYYLSSQVEAACEIIIPKKDVIIIMDVDDSFELDSTITVSGIVSTADDEAVANAEVSIVTTYSDATMTTVSVMTAEDGSFTAEVPASVLGAVSITASISNTTLYNDAEVSATTEIIKKVIETFLTVNCDDSANSGDLLSIDGVIYYNDADDNEIGLADVSLIIKVSQDDNTITQVNIITDEDGMISYNFDTTNLTGTLTVELLFEGNEDYLPSMDTTTVEVVKVKENVTINAEVDSPAYTGDEITITATLTDDNGNPIENKEVTLNINDEQVTITTDSNGLLAYTYTANMTGTIQINIISAEDENYLEAQTSLTLEVVKKATAISTCILNNTAGNVTLSVKVTDCENNTVTQGTVIVTELNTNSTMLVELAGDETIVLLNNEVGQYNYVVRYLGDDTYSESEENLNITVIAIEVKETNVSLNDTLIFINNTGKVTATVYDNESNPISEGQVIFTDSDNNIIGQADVVDGVASIDVLYDSGFTTQVTASYISNSQTISNSAATATLTVRQAMTILEINEVNLTVATEVNISVKVYDEAGNKISTGKVVFKINGKTLKDANGKVLYAKITNGTASITYTVPEDLAGENITLSASYSGNSKIPGAKNNTTITVNKKEATLTLNSPAEAQIASTITISATVNDEKTVNSGKIVFKINGKTLKDTNGKVIYAKIVNNTAVVEYTIPESMKAKTYTISAVLLSDEYDKLDAENNITITN